MQAQPLLAAVDLGSNSFRLQIARVEGEQFYMLDGLRESVRLAAGLTGDDYLDVAAQERALKALSRFSERLRGLPPEAVRAVGTNSLRVAKNAADFIPQAERALGFPIEVIAGREEARLIYMGVAHGLPPSNTNRLVMDIGGGSTEFIIGNGLEPIKLESLYMGCVSFSARFFADGKITKQNLKQADLAARSELQTIAVAYRGQWGEALGSSGTARMLAEILLQNGYSDGGITRDGLEQLRTYMLKVGDVQKLSLLGLKVDRLHAFAGGFSIMYAAFCELSIAKMQPAQGALREGVLYDLWGRHHDNDMRDVTVQQFIRRYHLDARQAKRVADLANDLARQFLVESVDEDAMRSLAWAAYLHEVGISVAHSGYHKHSAYILENADMPGFSKKEQRRLSLFSLAQRGGLEKLQGHFLATQDKAQLMALRLAILFYRNRSDVILPVLQCHFTGSKFHLSLTRGWLVQNPLTETALQEEIKRWKDLGISVQLSEV